MPLYTRDQLDTLVNKIKKGDIAKVYLLFGERFLCQQAAGRISEALLAKGGKTHMIDGEREDAATTLNRLRGFSLLPGRQLYRINDTKLFYSKNISQSLWKKASKAHDADKVKNTRKYLRAMLEAAGLDPGDPDSNPAELPASRWKSLFGFAKPGGDLSWTGKILAEEPSRARDQAGGKDPAALLENVLSTGFPEQNTLMLLAEEVDKRKRLYKLLKDEYVVVDLAVAGGSGSAAQKAQKSVLMDLINKTLAEFSQTMAPGVADLLLERVGFHPVAVVMETEKLALHAGERRRIEREDLDLLVGRTRQEALFELTAALGDKKLDQALLIAGRLRDNGIAALMIIATLRNYTRNLLLFRALLARPEAGPGATANPQVFQSRCLPALKETGLWSKELAGHPFALYMRFKTAGNFSARTLIRWLDLILAADLRLKRSPINEDTIIQNLIMAMLREERTAGLQNRRSALPYQQ